MKCKVCGVESTEGTAFCSGCGSSLKLDRPVSSPDAPSFQTCPKCGTQARLEAVFCPSCGFRLKTAVAPPPIVGNPVYAPQQYAQPQPQYAQPPYAQPQYAQPQYAQPQYAQPQYAQPQYAASRPAVAPRKKRKGLLVAVLLVLVIVLGGVGSYFVFGSEIRRMVLGPKNAYALIEAKNLKKDFAKMVDEVAGIGNLAERAATGGLGVDLQLKLDEAALGLDAQTAAAIAGITLQERMQVDWINGQPVYYNTLGLAVGDEKLMTLEIFTEGKTILLGLPEVLADYVRIDPAALAGSAGGAVDSSDASMALETVTLMDLEIDRAALEKSLFHLAEILLEHVDDTEFKSDQKLTAGNVSANYDTYTIILTSESAKAMVIDILKFARDDEALYNLAGRAMALEDGDSFEPVPMTDYHARIDEAILDIQAEEITEPFTLTHTAYVDNADNIVGRELLIREENSREATSIVYARPVAGANEAILLLVSSEGEKTTFLSEYEVIDGRKTGSAYLSSAGEEMFSADFSDIILSEVDRRQYLLGDVTLYLSPDAGMPETMDTMEFTGEMEGTDYLMTLTVPGFVELLLDCSYIPAGEVDIPDFSAVSAVDVSDTEAMQGLLTEEAMQNLSDIINQLGLPMDGLTITP